MSSGAIMMVMMVLVLGCCSCAATGGLVVAYKKGVFCDFLPSSCAAAAAVPETTGDAAKKKGCGTGKKWDTSKKKCVTGTVSNADYLKTYFFPKQVGFDYSAAATNTPVNSVHGLRGAVPEVGVGVPGVRGIEQEREQQVSMLLEDGCGAQSKTYSQLLLDIVRAQRR